MNIRNRWKLAKTKDKIKKYFLEKPDSDFWKSAFITLFFLKYVMPTMVIMLIMMMIGLVTPQVDPVAFNETQVEISQSMAETYVGLMYTMVESGQNIGAVNPFVAKIVFFSIGFVIFSIWSAALILMLNLSRYLISWIYRRVKGE